MRRLSMHMRGPIFLVPFKVRVIFDFLIFLGSQCVLIMFYYKVPQVPNRFPIAPQIYPIGFAQSSQ